MKLCVAYSTQSNLFYFQTLLLQLSLSYLCVLLLLVSLVVVNGQIPPSWVAGQPGYISSKAQNKGLEKTGTLTPEEQAKQDDRKKRQEDKDKSKF